MQGAIMQPWLCGATTPPCKPHKVDTLDSQAVCTTCGRSLVWEAKQPQRHQESCCHTSTHVQGGACLEHARPCMAALEVIAARPRFAVTIRLALCAGRVDAALDVGHSLLAPVVGGQMAFSRGTAVMSAPAHAGPAAEAAAAGKV